MHQETVGQTMLQQFFKDLTPEFDIWDQRSTVTVDKVMVQLQIKKT